MKGREHLGIGIVSAGLVFWMAQSAGAPIASSTVVAGAVVSGLGSLAPDIDHPHSLIGNRLPASLFAFGMMLVLAPLGFRLGASNPGIFSAVWAGMLQWTEPMLKWGALLLLLGAGMLYLSVKVTRAVQHRGPTHSLAAAGMATAVSFVICLILGLGPWFGVLFGLGWFSHLMADAITPAGLPSLLWPSVATEMPVSQRIFGFFLIPLVLLGVTGWFYSSRGPLVAPVATRASVTANPVGVNPAADVSLARKRLREAAPDIESGLVNADAPRVTSKGGHTSYTWQYLRKQASNHVTADTITVTLDGSGLIVGVDGP